MEQESYIQQQERIKAQQQNLSKEDIIDTIEAEYTLDLDNLQPQKHNWVRRGIVVSCEGAGHPSHRHFLTKRSS